MAFNNPSNHGRAAKIVELIGLISKSAQSNKATIAEVTSVLLPAVTALYEIGALEALRPPNLEALAEENHLVEATPSLDNTAALTAGQRAAQHLAARASMRDLICALMGRLEAQQAALSKGVEQ